MNKKLLLKIKEEILRRPTQFDMEYWLAAKNPKRRKVAMCGTTGCIAGWAVTLSSKRNVDKKLGAYSPKLAIRAYTNDEILDAWSSEGCFLREEAEKTLRLLPKQAGSLFYHYKWPNDLRHAYEKARGPKAKAKVAARAIDRFIETNGDWLSHQITTSAL